MSCLTGAVHGELDAAAEICDALEGKQEVDHGADVTGMSSMVD